MSKIPARVPSVVGEPQAAPPAADRIERIRRIVAREMSALGPAARARLIRVLKRMLEE